MDIYDWIKSLGIGSGATIVVLFVMRQLDWLRFLPKDKATVRRLDSQSSVDLAAADSKKIEDEVRISKAALEWTVQIAAQLEKSNFLNEKLRGEIDRLHQIIDSLKLEFEKKIDAFETQLESARKECDDERKKNIKLQRELQKYIDGNRSK